MFLSMFCKVQYKIRVRYDLIRNDKFKATVFENTRIE